MTESTFPSPRSRLAALIDEARRRGRRRNLALVAIGLLALLVGGGIWAGLELSGGGRGAAAVHAPPGYHVVRSQGPVARRVLETWNPSQSQPVSVDLATGTERPVRTTSETWYDGRGHVNRVVTRADGRVQHDDAYACPRECFPGFSFQSYWPLDTSRYTRQPGIGTFHGRSVIWIAPRLPGGFAAPPGVGERIGLDPRTHEPVADRMYNEGKISSEALVLERKPDIATGKYSFVVPNPTRGRLGKEPTAELSARGSDPYALRARRALGQRPLWLGERFDGNRLQAVTIGSTFDPPTGISPKATRYVLYDYGNVAIAEFNARELYGAGGGPLPGRMTLQKPFPLTGSASVDVVGPQLIRDGVFVLAYKSQHGNYVLNRAGALRVARALRPVPLP